MDLAPQSSLVKKKREMYATRAALLAKKFKHLPEILDESFYQQLRTEDDKACLARDDTGTTVHFFEKHLLSLGKVLEIADKYLRRVAA